MKKIIIAGGSGLIGSSLSSYFTSAGHKVFWLSRGQKENSYPVYNWNPENQYLDEAALWSKDVLIQLTGCSIADKPWTFERKNEIINSRIQAIKTLCFHLKKENIRIPQIIQMSAIAYYGNEPDKVWTENNNLIGGSFLQTVCQIWEEEAQCLKGFTDHFSILRTGLYLSPTGGIWPKMIQTKTYHFLNYFGNGKQFYSWIHYKDFNRAVTFLIDNQLSGIFNLTAPHPVMNKFFMKQVCNLSSTKTFLFSVPEFILKFILGEQSELVLSSSNVIPKALLDNGFNFQFNKVEEAIKELLNEEKDPF